jgi:hypothetical protein
MVPIRSEAGSRRDIPRRHLRHVNENGMYSVQFPPMLDISLDEVALKLLRQALNADADPAIARMVVLRKLSGLYRRTPECELRNALARAWAVQRHRRRVLPV